MLCNLRPPDVMLVLFRLFCFNYDAHDNCLVGIQASCHGQHPNWNFKLNLCERAFF